MYLYRPGQSEWNRIPGPIFDTFGRPGTQDRTNLLRWCLPLFEVSSHSESPFFRLSEIKIFWKHLRQALFQVQKLVLFLCCIFTRPMIPKQIKISLTRKMSYMKDPTVYYIAYNLPWLFTFIMNGVMDGRTHGRSPSVEA